MRHTSYMEYKWGKSKYIIFLDYYKFMSYLYIVEYFEKSNSLDFKLYLHAISSLVIPSVSIPKVTCFKQILSCDFLCRRGMSMLRPPFGQTSAKASASAFTATDIDTLSCVHVKSKFQQEGYRYYWIFLHSTDQLQMLQYS